MWYIFDSGIEILVLMTPYFVVSCGIFGSFTEIYPQTGRGKNFPSIPEHAATMSACDARALALSACASFWSSGNSDATRKRKQPERESDDDVEAVAAGIAAVVAEDTQTQCTAGCQEADHGDEWLSIYKDFARDTRSMQSKPRGRQSQIEQWISDPFWFTDCEFRRNLRVTHNTFLHIVQMVQSDVKDSVNPLTGKVVRRKEFKVAVYLYHLGHGGTWRTTANVAAIGVSTARKYVMGAAAAVVKHMKPRYMPGTPCKDRLARVTRKFTERRGLGNVAMTIDGCHVPWTPDCAHTREDYHNYKGWHSILCLMFVDSYYMFVDGEVGHPGRQSDSAISEFSWLLNEMREHREEWLGKDGIVIGDGGFAQDDFLMTPFANARTNRDHLFNFCFSSTRFYVEQAFGWFVFPCPTRGCHDFDFVLNLQVEESLAVSHSRFTALSRRSVSDDLQFDDHAQSVCGAA